MLVFYFFLFKLCVISYAMMPDEIEDFSNYLIESSKLDQQVKSYNVGSRDDVPVSDNAWENSGKFEGDIILNEAQRKMILSEVVEGLARNGVTDTTKRWPNKELVYYINTNHFSADQLDAIQDAIEGLSGISCVKFRPYKKGDLDAVVIQGSRGGCFSQVGYQSGYQILNLDRRHPSGRGCFRQGTIMHEILHALGFYHMQSSPDRDDYVHVLWDNIIKRARHNFRKYDVHAVSDFGVGYDYMSVLHYSRKAFSSNGQDTLVPKTEAHIGQREGLSDKDVLKLIKMYCDEESDVIKENGDVSDDVEKKRKPKKNKPFGGHGLGYEKGKTVIIKLPKGDVKPQVSSDVDYFSKKVQEVTPSTFIHESPIEEIALYNYQFPKIHLNEYDMRLINTYPKGNYDEIKLIESNNEKTRKPQTATEAFYENLYKNTETPNDESIRVSNNKEIIGFSPVVLEKDNVENINEYSAYNLHIPRSSYQNRNNVKPKIPSNIQKSNKYSYYNPVIPYESLVSYPPNRSSEKKRDFPFSNTKYDSTPTLGYESFGDYANDDWHSNENYKTNLYMQERPNQHDIVVYIK